MPSTYAHYRFGAEAVSLFSKDAQRAIRHFRSLYDAGLQGPDPFFHHNILKPISGGNPGKTIHAMTGEAFFIHACKRLRMHPSEAGAAYLYGFLAHYVLDSLCHPFIEATVAEGEVNHVEMETEFDRFLLDVDHLYPPYRQDFSRYLRLTRNECATAADLLPAATPGFVRRCTRNMARHVHLLATVNPKLIHAVLKPLGKDIAFHQMTAEPNRNCAYLDGRLYELYGQAMELLPYLAQQLEEHITDRSPLGDDFQRNFG